MPALQSQTTANMLLCISSQGLATVHDAREPPSPVIQESPLSVLNVIVPILLFFPHLLYQAIQSLFMFLHILLFFPDLLYQALKSLSNSFTYPFAQPLSRVAKGSKHEPQNSNKEATPASLEPPMEFDIEKEVWKEEHGCFANQITNHTLHLQVAGDVRAAEIYFGRLDEDIVGLRELEGKAWEADSEGEQYWDAERSDDDGGCVAKLGGGEWRWRV